MKHADRLATWILRDERAPHVNHDAFTSFLQDKGDDCACDYVLHTPAAAAAPDSGARSSPWARRCAGICCCAADNAGIWDNPSDGVYHYADDEFEGGDRYVSPPVIPAPAASPEEPAPPASPEEPAPPASPEEPAPPAPAPVCPDATGSSPLADDVVVVGGLRAADAIEEDDDDGWETVVSKKRGRRR